MNKGCKMTWPKLTTPFVSMTTLGLMLFISGAVKCAMPDLVEGNLPSKRTANNPTSTTKPVSIDTLLQAAKSGNSKSLESSVAAGADINQKGDLGQTPLMVAVVVKKHKCVLWLLLHDGNPNLQDYKGRSAVSLAAGLEDNTRILTTILKYGGDPNIVQRKSKLQDGTVIYPNTTPIYDAISSGNRSNVEVLIRAGAKTDPKISSEVASPLAWAISLEEFDIAYLLIQAGADFQASSLATGLTIVEALEAFDLRLIAIDELDAAKRKKLQKERTASFFRVLELLKKKGVDVRRNAQYPKPRNHSAKARLEK
jgi:hypothetical protein